MCSLDSAQRIREAKANASGAYDLIYFGWLGSLKNLVWVIENHSAKSTGSTFPFPTIEDYEDDNVSGTALWGAYAYHINEQGYNAITSALKRDVGGMSRSKVLEVCLGQKCIYDNYQTYFYD